MLFITCYGIAMPIMPILQPLTLWCGSHERAVATTFTFFHNKHPRQCHNSHHATLPHLSPCCCQYCTITVLLLQYNACHAGATNLVIPRPSPRRCHNSLGCVAIWSQPICFHNPQLAVALFLTMLWQQSQLFNFSDLICAVSASLCCHAPHHIIATSFAFLLPHCFLCCCRINHIAVAMNYSNILRGLALFLEGPLPCLFTASS